MTEVLPASRFEEAPPLSLYVHLPWCVRKCPYCDFNSKALNGEMPEEAYIDSLLVDLDLEAERCKARSVMTVFIGGGTPSLFSARSIARILDHAAKRLSLSSAAEVTLEANPGASDQSRFVGYRTAGVNRLSIGVQSFDDGLLNRIGRIHDGQAALRAVHAARCAGFDNLNLDLMYGLPGQTAQQAARDLSTAIGLNPGHISWYQLTLEPNTEFHHRPPALPREAIIESMEGGAQTSFRENDYTQYEVSAYARTDRRCMHNLNYWTFGDYLGIGAGAHGKLTNPVSGTVVRRCKEKHPTRFIENAARGDASVEVRELEPRDLVFEFMLNALRLSRGFERRLFEQRTGLCWETVAPLLGKAASQALVDIRTDEIAPTFLGRRYLNDLIERFLPENACAH